MAGWLAAALAGAGCASGVVASIVRDDRVQTYGYGKAMEGGAVPDAHRLFEIGSITKLFTTLTLATMVTDGERRVPARRSATSRHPGPTQPPQLESSVNRSPLPRSLHRQPETA